MKIVLIETKSTHIHVYSAVPIPRVGSVLLGTILRNLGHQVDVYIEEMGEVDYEVLYQADLVGISALTSTAPRSYRIASQARAAGIPVVLGGTHVTFEPDEALDYAEYVVRGEGEETFPELLQAIENGSGFEHIAGLSWRNGEEKVHNPDRPFLNDLDVNPIPDFSIVQHGRGAPIVSIMTGRGCPFECTFCTVPQFNGRGFRTHSVERILEELQFHIRQRDLKFLFFADDIFNLKKKRMAQILEGMIRNNFNVRWGAQVRHEISRDAEALQLMKRAGCGRVYVGFESINPRTLELFKKHETRDDVESAIHNFHAHGIKVHGMFVVGSDEDTAETIVETRRFAQEHDIDSVQFMILTPMPGTVDAKRFEEQKRPILSKDWSIYDGHHAVHVPRKMTPYDLQIGAVTAMKDFYNLSSILRRVLRGDLFDAAIRVHGYRLTRKWFKEEGNIQYMERLRNDLFQQFESLGVVRPRKPTKSVVLNLSDNLHQYREHMEVFFRELGVRVIDSRDNLLAAVEEGNTRIANQSAALGKQVLEYLERFKGKADYVVVASAEEGDGHEEQGRWSEIRSEIRRMAGTVNERISQIPQLVHLPADLTGKRVPEMFASLGLLFTEDLERIRRATCKALAEA